MRLRATVGAGDGLTVHGVGETGNPMGRPDTLEIAETRDGVFLFRLDVDGLCVADTWHESVAAAKRQALAEYGIEGPGWELVH